MADSQSVCTSQPATDIAFTRRHIVISVTITVTSLLGHPSFHPPDTDPSCCCYVFSSGPALSFGPALLLPLTRPAGRDSGIARDGTREDPTLQIPTPSVGLENPFVASTVLLFPLLFFFFFFSSSFLLLHTCIPIHCRTTSLTGGNKTRRDEWSNDGMELWKSRWIEPWMNGWRDGQ